MIRPAHDTAVLQQRQKQLPRLGFVGVGWIGRLRMEALLDGRHAVAAAIVEPDERRRRQARQLAPDARPYGDLSALLAREDVDGVVIATPSALHAEQALQALEAGVPVFCQKPLGRTATETRLVVEAARRADRLLAVDLCYRRTEAMQQIRHRVREGDLGHVFAADLAFHNAYGPDKAWFYEPNESGGGCVIDLGVHLVDLALWTLDFPNVERVTSRLFAGGQRLETLGGRVEDYATAHLDLVGGTSVRLACSWNLPAGRDAVIEAAFYGTNGGLALHNAGGSFFDFCAERFEGTARTVLAEPPDDWGGRTVSAWAQQLAVNPRYDASIEHVVDVAAVVDAIYDRRTLPT